MGTHARWHEGETETRGSERSARSGKKREETSKGFNECAQPGPCILETIWCGLFGTGTRRLEQTKTGRESRTPAHNCAEMSCHGDCAAPSGFSRLIHTFRAQARLCLMLAYQKRDKIAQGSTNMNFDYGNKKIDKART